MGNAVVETMTGAAVADLAAAFVGPNVMLGMFVEVGGAVGVVDEGADEDGELAFSMIHLPSSHRYPRGQHASPHFASVVVRSVVWIMLPGYSSGSCWVMSQTIGWIRAQSKLAGQHIAVEPPLKEMQAVPDGQQKFGGSSPPHVFNDCVLQVSSSRRSRPKAFPAPTAATRAKA